MYRTVLFALILSISASIHLQAQTSISTYVQPATEGGAVIRPVNPAPVSPVAISRFSLSGGVSPLGIEVEATTNVQRHLNLRASGSLFDYATSFNTSGFAAQAKLRLASVRTSLDVYPFHSGFRISPGLLLYNQNRVTASDTVASGTSFTLNDDTFYSANTNAATGATPIRGTALLNLHARRPAFTITGGWGNPLARRGHWSFPVEVGVALAGAPKLTAELKGWACHDRGQTECVNVADQNNAIAVQVQNDLQAQLGKWNKEIEPLKTYPIVSAGVAYSFHTRRTR